MNHRGHREHRELQECDVGLTEAVIGAAIRVHTTMGPGLLESVYEAALALELIDAGFTTARQVEIAVSYRGRDLGTAFRADLIVNDRLLLELKCVDHFHPIHVAQVMTYLKLLRFKRGLLINFNQTRLTDGIKRISI